MKKQYGLILTAAACMMLTGCKKKISMEVVSVDYASRDHVEDAYNQLAGFAASISTQMDSGWTAVSPSAFGLPDIFRTEGYELVLDLSDRDGDGYKELTVGLQVEDEDRIYLFYTVTEDGTVKKVFVTSAGSYMVKEGAYYAVYKPEETEFITEYQTVTEEEASEEEYTENEEEYSEEDTEYEEEYAESEEDELWNQMQEVINASITESSSEETESAEESSSDNGYLPAGTYKFENGVMTAQQ